MISRVKVDGNYLETIDEKGKRIKRAYNNGDFLGNSSEIVVVQDGNYIEVLDEDLKRISRRENSMSAMPAMGRMISRRELRDLMEYLSSLKNKERIIEGEDKEV